MRKKLFALVVAVTLLIILLIGWSVFNKQFAQKMISSSPEPAAVVDVAPVKKVVWEETVETVGTIKAQHSVDIASEVGGKISKVSFHSGEAIAADAVLVEMNPKVLRAVLKSNEAKLKLARLNLRRLESLVKSHATADSVLDQARAQFEEATGMVQQNLAELEQLVIRAPFAGRVGLRKIDVGEYLAPGSVIINLQSVDPMEVDFLVPETFLTKIHRGQEVSVRSRIFPTKVFKGKIIAFASTIDSRSRTLAVRATVANPKQLLYPGLYADVHVSLNDKQQVIAVSTMAINYSLSGDSVYIVEKGHAKQRYVKLGHIRDGIVEIKSGLKSGEIIVTNGQMKLHPGSPVTIAKK